jgi:hypothetical protein
MRLNATESQISRLYRDNPVAVPAKGRVNQAGNHKHQKLEEFNDKLNQPDTILSDSEKKFFKSIFPESQETLDRHIVFNRNGKVQSKTFSLGTLLDAKV